MIPCVGCTRGASPQSDSCDSDDHDDADGNERTPQAFYGGASRPRQLCHVVARRKARFVGLSLPDLGDSNLVGIDLPNAVHGLGSLAVGVSSLRAHPSPRFAPPESASCSVGPLRQRGNLSIDV